jgi:hypothetical protein
MGQSELLTVRRSYYYLSFVRKLFLVPLLKFV